MFEFVNERLINSATDAYSGLPKFQVLNDKKTLRIYRFGDFDAGNIVNRTVYKTRWSAPRKPIIKINITDTIIPKEDGVVKNIRLMIDLRRRGSVNSEYSTYNSRIKAKPMVANMEIKKGDTKISIAETLVQIFKDQDFLYDNLRVNIHTDSSTKYQIVIEGEDEFQYFHNVEIQELVPWNVAALGTYYPVEPVWRTLLTYVGKNNEDTQLQNGELPERFGKEGFGTYWTMLKNVQIQNSKRTDIFAVDNDDTRLIPGVNYNQYVLDYRVKRDITGMQAVGQELVSVTKHVMWVNADLEDQFDEVLKSAGIIVNDVDIKAADRTDEITVPGTFSASVATDGTNGKVLTILSEPDEGERALGWTIRCTDESVAIISDVSATTATVKPLAEGSAQLVIEFEDNVTSKVVDLTVSA